MPTQQVICRREKAVVVSVYEEKPRKKVPSNHHHHHHHHHHYHIVHNHDDVRKGYDRRAELLRYSQFLRESARSTPLLSKQTHVVSSQRKQKNEGKHGCFCSWKLLVPSFLKPWISLKAKEKRKKKQMHGGFSVNQITNVMDKLGVKRRKGLKSIFPTVFSSRRKRF